MRVSKELIDSILTYDFLYQKYIVEELSTYEICKLTNNIVKREKMRLRLIELGIPVRTRKQCKNTVTSREKMRSYLGSTETKQKRISTSLSRYGVENPSQFQLFKDRKIESSQRHYGTNYPLQNEVIKNRFQKSCLSHYGVDNPNKSKLIRNKIKETCIRKYGYSASFLDPNIRRKCIDSLNQYKGGCSKVSLRLFDSLCKSFNSISHDFKYSGHGDEVCIKNGNGSCYYLDFSYDKDGIKFDIEFNGDYYHMNPSIHKEDELVPFPNEICKTASDIWKYDQHRKEVLESNGFRVLTVWEYDYIHDPSKVIQECCNFINDCLRT